MGAGAKDIRLRFVVMTSLVVFAAAMIVSIREVVRALSSPATPETTEPEQAAAAPESHQAPPNVAPAVAAHTAGPGERQRPQTGPNNLDIETVKILRAMHYAQLEEARRYAREHPDAPDALSEEQLEEMAKKEITTH